MEADNSDAAAIRSLEERLLQPAVRRSANAVAELLADEFVEFGSSGRVFNKQQIIAALQDEDGASRSRLTDFRATRLAPGIILVTYRATRPVGTRETSIESLRSSIWKQIEGRWQMVFHQGTRSTNA